MISSGLPSPACGEVRAMLDVLVPIVLASVASSGFMWLLDVVDKPSRQKESRARSGARARHKV